MTGTDDERAGPMPNPPHLGELIRESMAEPGGRWARRRLACAASAGTQPRPQVVW